MSAQPQEQAWAGEFGNEYHKRSPGLVAANFSLFEAIFSVNGIQAETILELGAGTGANVQALRQLNPKAKITAVELNKAACVMMASDNPDAQVVEASLLEWQAPQQWDLVLTKGVLIHIPPRFLPAVYETIHRAAGRYVLIAEYYNPTPVDVLYRGEPDKLWKRDFAGELLDRYPDLRLRDYGFVYHRDLHFCQDDLTWFLLERK